MSRIRTIKPEFFLDDELAELTPLTRLLFIGLWTLADCEGRLEDRPKRIRAQLHPFGDGDTDAMLQALHDRGFIYRYTANSLRCIEIRSFKKHQRLSGKEAEGQSALPPRESGEKSGSTGEAMGKQRGSDGEAAIAQEGKGKEGNGADTRPARPAPAPRTPLPADLAITPELQAWANEHGYGDLAAHLEHFRDKATAHGYQYADWMAAFRNAVRDDWAGLRKKPASATTQPDFPVSRLSQAGEQQRRNLEAWLQQDTTEVVAHELH